MDINAIISEHDQDLENALKWWGNTPDGDKAKVWLVIQEMDGSAMNEIVSRFAQIGFEYVMLKSNERGNEPTGATKG